MGDTRRGRDGRRDKESCKTTGRGRSTPRRVDYRQSLGVHTLAPGAALSLWSVLGLVVVVMDLIDRSMHVVCLQAALTHEGCLGQEGVMHLSTVCKTMHQHGSRGRWFRVPHAFHKRDETRNAECEAPMLPSSTCTVPRRCPFLHFRGILLRYLYVA